MNLFQNPYGSFLAVFGGREGWKAPTLFMTLRVATTGQQVSPPLFESMEVLGREQVLRRIDRAASIL